MNKKFYILNVLTICILINCAQTAYGTDIAAGEKIFTANCSACHNGGNNVIAPEKTLKKDKLVANAMDNVNAITNQVTNGKEAMPPFGGRLSDEDINNVANYVLSQAEQGW